MMFKTDLKQTKDVLDPSIINKIIILISFHVVPQTICAICTAALITRT